MFTAANKGSYIAQAGQTNPVLNAFQVANAYSFDAFDLAQSAMKADTAKYISKVENEAKKNYYKSVGKADIQGLKEVGKARDKAQGQQQMAGRLGLLGALAYGTSRYFDDKNNPPPKPIPQEKIDISSLLADRSALEKQTKEVSQSLKDAHSTPIPKITFNDDNTASGTTRSTVKPVAFTGGGAGWGPLGSTIKFAEGTYGDKSYNTGYGHNMFDSLDKHPDTVWHTASGSSAAAGAYQIMPGTWQTVVQPKLNLPDFSPESQEKAGEYLASRRGIATDKIFTTRQELRNALHLGSSEWAGLPTFDDVSAYEGINGNKSVKFNSLADFYEKQVRLQKGLPNFKLK